MLENILFGSVAVPGEMIRLVIAFLGVIVATYYDLFNRKNVPDGLLYGFLAVAVLANLVYYFIQPDMDLLIFTVGAAAFLAGIGYVFYRFGQICGADVIVIAAVMLLMPFAPSFAKLNFNLPFILPVMIYAGLLFAIYATAKFGIRVFREGGQPKWLYALLIIPYLLFAYIFMTSPIFTPVYFGVITVLLLCTVFFMMYKDDINLMLADELPLEQLEAEDVVALELIDRDVVKKYQIKRLLKTDEIARLKAEGIQTLWVYTQLPPFIPFLLAGMMLTLFFSKALLFGL
ncbi:MAG: hypothetical protein V1492_01725 [Candidatus Micrarchaeota archaeon]